MNTQTEARTITQTFQAHGVAAKVVKTFNTPGFILYGIRKAPEERINRIESMIDELALTVSEHRGRSVKVRLQHPPIMLEVPRRNPRPIAWPATLPNGPHSAAIGRGYEWGRATDQIIDFDRSPHTLIAGITGSGKSVLELGMIESVAAGTSPSECRFLMIDMKNSALRKVANLPHVDALAGNEADAMAIIDKMIAESVFRRDHPDAPKQRIILWIDELARIPSDGLEKMNTLLALGREQWLNIVSVTQHPTAEILGGSAGKVNYTTRLVGLVTDGTAAATATGRRGTGAEFLPGRGAFLRVEGSDLIRFQAYWLSDDDIEAQQKRIVAKWGQPKKSPVPVSAPVEPEPDPLFNLFSQYHDGIGGLKRGGIAAAIRAAYGPDAATTGRRYQEQREYVQERFHEWV